MSLSPGSQEQVNLSVDEIAKFKPSDLEKASPELRDIFPISSYSITFSSMMPLCSHDDDPEQAVPLRILFSILTSKVNEK